MEDDDEKMILCKALNIMKRTIEQKDVLIETHHGTMERCTTKVTGKGQLYFVNGFVTGRFKTDNQSLGIPNYKFYKLSKLSIV